MVIAVFCAMIPDVSVILDKNNTICLLSYAIVCMLSFLIKIVCVYFTIFLNFGKAAIHSCAICTIIVNISLTADSFSVCKRNIPACCQKDKIFHVQFLEPLYAYPSAPI